MKKASDHKFNLDFLAEMEDDEYAMDVLQTFLQETPVVLDKLYKAAEQKNYKEVDALAHQLKGCISLFRISDMLRLLELIQQTVLSENGNLLEMVIAVISIYHEVESSLLKNLNLMKTNFSRRK